VFLFRLRETEMKMIEGTDYTQRSQRFEYNDVFQPVS
jgi:hypothetical protein